MFSLEREVPPAEGNLILSVTRLILFRFGILLKWELSINHPVQACLDYGLLEKGALCLLMTWWLKGTDHLPSGSFLKRNIINIHVLMSKKWLGYHCPGHVASPCPHLAQGCLRKWPRGTARGREEFHQQWKQLSTPSQEARHRNYIERVLCPQDNVWIGNLFSQILLLQFTASSGGGRDNPFFK